MSTKHSAGGLPPEVGVKWDLVRDADGYDTEEVNVEESEALSFSAYRIGNTE
jgi:hypothetical protein